MEVIKVFMKKKRIWEKHIQDIQDVEHLAGELQKYPCLYEKENT